MKYLLLSVGLAVTAPLFLPTAANAVVCARGVYRAGCAGPNGSVVVRRRPVYVAPVHGCRWVWRYGRRVRVCT
jgi:hypothetical protein